MTELRLVSNGKRALRPIVEAALHNEIRLLEVGLRRSQQRLQQFEAQYGLSTSQFIQRYENDEMKESLEFAEWIGEYRISERLQEKIDTLSDIRFAN